MVVFNLTLTNAKKDVVKVEAMLVSDVIYVRITLGSTVYRGYVMLATANGNNIF
jgi:hypothetical protein